MTERARDQYGGKAVQANSWLYSSLQPSRQLLVIIGLVAVILAAFLGDGSAESRLAALVLIALGVGAGLGWIEAISAPRTRLEESSEPSRAPRRTRLLAAGALAAFSALAAQSWFHYGTVIASGDVAPPSGTAWTSRLFVAWAWSGWNLGGPSALESQLPWGALLAVTHSLGGSAELAQRIWYTMLFAGAAVACFAVLSTLDLRPAAASIGAIAYVLSPYVVSYVVPNPIYLATLFVLPAVPAAILAGAKGLVRIRTAVILVAASGPMMGFVYLNPPLLGAVIAVALSTPLVAGWLYGRETAQRAAVALCSSVLLVLAVSAYWVIPAAIQLGGTAHGQLVTISSWIWTEGRATLQNAFWLNTAWGWVFPDYYPYAHVYDTFPLSILKFIPAIIAFAALAVTQFAPESRHCSSSFPLRLAIVSGTAALALIVISTGTNTPGSIVFDRLYALPYGWLLREPGRFLIVADLMYAVLIGLSIEALLKLLSRPRLEMNGFAGPLAAALIAFLIVIPGFPMFTGAVVPDKRILLPSDHVTIPKFWPEMAKYVDASSVSGALLVLPQDDFYQMPYTWGYYGNDGFIVDMMRRPVLLPVADGYDPASPQLLSTVGLVAKGILAGNWLQVDRLMKVLGSPLVLVRGDVDVRFPGRTFIPPTSLATSLEHSPMFELVHVAGPLELFALRGIQSAVNETALYYATVDTVTPDLRVLPALPEGAALVSSSPQSGVPFVQELPPLSEWTEAGDRLVWEVPAPVGWTYSLVRLDTAGRQLGNGGIPNALTVLDQGRDRSSPHVEVTLSIRNALKTGAFISGGSAQVADCASNSAPGSNPNLSAIVEPAGGPSGGEYVRLSARSGSACVAQHLDWRGGPVLISLGVRHVMGANPRLCLWEVGPQRCTTLPQLDTSEAWTAYRATASPDLGTTALDLFLYSDAVMGNGLTENNYADVHALEVPFVPQLDLVGTPLALFPTSSLEVQHTGYSPNWQGPPGATHVLVDGMLNGWVVSKGRPIAVSYVGEGRIRLGIAISILGSLIALGLALSVLNLRLVHRRR